MSERKIADLEAELYRKGSELSHMMAKERSSELSLERQRLSKMCDAGTSH